MDIKSLNDKQVTQESTDLFALFEGKLALAPLEAGVYSVLIEDSELKLTKTKQVYINIKGTIGERPVTVTLFKHPNFDNISRFVTAYALDADLEGQPISQLLQSKPWVGKEFTFTYQHQVNGEYDNHNWMVGVQQLEYIKEVASIF